MQAVVRRYSGQDDKKPVDLLEKHRTEIERLMRSIDGFASYSLVAPLTAVSRSQSMTKGPTSTRVFCLHGIWVAKNADTAGSGVAAILEGAAVLQVARTLSTEGGKAGSTLREPESWSLRGQPRH